MMNIPHRCNSLDKIAEKYFHLWIEESSSKTHPVKESHNDMSDRKF